MRDWLCTNAKRDEWAYVEWAQPGKQTHTLYLITVWRGRDEKWWWQITGTQLTGYREKRADAMNDALHVFDTVEVGV